MELINFAWKWNKYMQSIFLYSEWVDGMAMRTGHLAIGFLCFGRKLSSLLCLVKNTFQWQANKLRLFTKYPMQWDVFKDS